MTADLRYDGARRPRPSLAPVLALGAHLLAILLALVWLAAAGSDANHVQNIALGMSRLVLGVLGLPWSIPAVIGTDGFSDAGDFAVVTAVALVNLALHALAWWLVAWRRARRA